MRILTEKATTLAAKAYTAAYIKLHDNKGDGGQAVGWIVGIAVVLLVAIALFAFKDKVTGYISDAGKFIESDTNFNI